MKKRLVKTIHCENGQLYSIVKGQRFLVAECEPRIEIYEHSTEVTTFGTMTCPIKKRHITIAICSDMDYTRTIDEKFIGSVSAFEVQADIQRVDGVFENIVFNNLCPVEIDLDIDWTFEVKDNAALLNKLLKL